MQNVNKHFITSKKRKTVKIYYNIGTNALYAIDLMQQT